MKCLNCDGTDFEKKSIRIDTEYAGEALEVVALAHVCKKCHEPLMDSKQMNVLRQAAADKYKIPYTELTADGARQIALAVRDLKVSAQERMVFQATMATIENTAEMGKLKLEVSVPKECDNAIRLRLRALGYKAEWGQMTANVTFIKVSFE